MTSTWWKGLVKKKGEGGHPRKKKILSLLPKSCEKSDWSWWGTAGVRGNTYLKSSCIWGKADTPICVQRDGGKAVEDSKLHFIRLHNGPSWSTKTRLRAVRALQLAWFLKGGRAGWRWAEVVLSPNYLISSLVLRSQPIQFTYIWLPLSKRHTLDDTICYIRFTILQWCSKEPAKYLRYMRFMASD